MTVPYTFGNESSPIPLSQLDANFAAPVTFATTAGNIINSAQPAITSVGVLTSLSVSGNVVSSNVVSSGVIVSSGNISGANVLSTGNMSAYGTVIGTNISAIGNLTANIITAATLIQTPYNIIGGNISTGGNITAQGKISATGNVETAQYFIGNFQGNITGNLSVGGSNTQILFNNNGNVGAAGGLTFDSGSNIFTVLGNIVSTNLKINGTTQLVGVATAPTATIGTANNQIATTAFVSSTVGAFGTIASQNASNVSITGGVISSTNLTGGNIVGGNISSGNISNTNITTSTVDKITMAGGWTITPNGSTLYFGFNGSNVAKLDSAGNFTTIGDVTAFGTL